MNVPPDNTGITHQPFQCFLVVDRRLDGTIALDELPIRFGDMETTELVLSGTGRHEMERQSLSEGTDPTG